MFGFALQASRLVFPKKLLLVIAFFVITPFTLFVNLFLFHYIVGSTNPKGVVLASTTSISFDSENNFSIENSLPKIAPGIYGKVNSSDARPELIRKYLEKAKSPLEPYSQIIVDAADKHKLDYRLLTAIAQKESGLCRVIPPGSHNCWGWGIHKKGTLMFDSYDESIEAVSLGLRKNYIDKGYVTIEEIMSKWVPHSPNGVWAEGVNAYLEQIQ